MKKIVCLFGVILLCVACGKKAENNDEVTSTVNGSDSKSDHSGVYAYEQNGDTIRLQLTVDNGTATGSLVYALNEKDRNSGTLEGEITNGILLGDYTFNSEGMVSKRQIAFKLTDSSAIEGFGYMEEFDGKMVFKNTDALNFGTDMILTKK